MLKFEREGVKLHYEVHGDPESSHVLVFLNGVMASTSSWEQQLPAFKRLGYKIILHDFRGQLRSDKPPGPYTFAMHAEDTMALLKHLDVHQAHFIGTSYGGEVGMKIAVMYPEAVATLTIINAVSELDDTLRYFVSNWRTLAASGDGATFFEGMVPTIYHQHYIAKNKAMLQTAAGTIAKLPTSFLEGQITLYDTFLNDLNLTEELHKITAPTLIICGADDLLKPPKFSHIIAKKIKHSEYVLIPECAHVTIYEKPEELSTLLVGFIQKNQV